MKPDTPSYLNFNTEAYAWKPDIDYRRHPELYRVGKGEQGVLICEPYKSEIGPNWRFKDEAIARESSEKIFRQFLEYLNCWCRHSAQVPANGLYTRKALCKL